MEDDGKREEFGNREREKGETAKDEDPKTFEEKSQGGEPRYPKKETARVRTQEPLKKQPGEGPRR